MEKEIGRLREILRNSNYTVALCGSGMTEESGFIGIKKPERAYEIERVYGASPEEIFTSSYYNTRPMQFFKFYHEEILDKIPEPGPSSHIMAAMERAGHLHCIITSNIFDQEKRGGCENVIDLHGTIFMNRCPHCGEYYSVEDIQNSKGVPYCMICHSVIRPLVSLFGGDGGQPYHDENHRRDRKGGGSAAVGDNNAVRGVFQLCQVLQWTQPYHNS